MFNKFFKWLFIFSLSRAALTSFLLSVSETTTFSVVLFSVFIFGLPNQFFSPVGTSTFFNCLLALASTSIGTFSLKANNSFFFSDKSFSSCFISCSKFFFSLLSFSSLYYFFIIICLFFLCYLSPLYILLFYLFYVQFHVPTAFVLIAELLFLANLQMVEFYSMSNLVE